MAASTLIGFLIITNASYYADEIESPWAPVVFMAIISFTVGGLFMAIYGMACDTIL
jgi:general stress protein CsbA